MQTIGKLIHISKLIFGPSFWGWRKGEEKNEWEQSNGAINIASLLMIWWLLLVRFNQSRCWPQTGLVGNSWTYGHHALIFMLCRWRGWWRWLWNLRGGVDGGNDHANLKINSNRRKMHLIRLFNYNNNTPNSFPHDLRLFISMKIVFVSYCCVSNVCWLWIAKCFDST